jgi:nucleoside-diphosphate kinase
MAENSLVILKPDAYIRDYVGARVVKTMQSVEGVTINRFEETKVDREFLAEEHYKKHKGKFFHDWLVEFVSSTPVYVLKVGGENRIHGVRDILGDSIVEHSSEGTIRDNYGIIGGVNVVHASDSKETAEREMELWSEYFDTENKTVSVNQFVENNINKPMIDVKRYREISHQIMNENIQEEKAVNEFAELLEKESSAKNKYIRSLAHLLVRNAVMRK